MYDNGDVKVMVTTSEISHEEEALRAKQQGAVPRLTGGSENKKSSVPASKKKQFKRVARKRSRPKPQSKRDKKKGKKKGTVDTLLSDSKSQNSIVTTKTALDIIVIDGRNNDAVQQTDKIRRY
ncbi:hypothetical protein RJ639_009462 [Escallonia herrerae]|uniref:Uncharacterized protein n=1 Tax=Escallonia herrerae TaxID=1293975 RepID=A0AA88VQC1_9ASTE|nr:hypothetical protein RJ639_009462 [Escallonia herrerae]